MCLSKSEWVGGGEDASSSRLLISGVGGKTGRAGALIDCRGRYVLCGLSLICVYLLSFIYAIFPGFTFLSLILSFPLLSFFFLDLSFPLSSFLLSLSFPFLSFLFFVFFLSFPFI